MSTSGRQVQTRREQWRAMIDKQAQSGLSIRAFCIQEGVRDADFYHWRKRLREAEPMRFALVEAGGTALSAPGPIELHLASGDRLKIGAGVDAATLRAVLSVLRERA